MTTRPTLITVLAVVLTGSPLAQQPSRQGGAATANALLKKFDKNGDGKLDDEQRRAAREALRRTQAKRGAITTRRNLDLGLRRRNNAHADRGITATEGRAAGSFASGRARKFLGALTLLPLCPATT